MKTMPIMSGLLLLTSACPNSANAQQTGTAGHQTNVPTPNRPDCNRPDHNNVFSRAIPSVRPNENASKKQTNLATKCLSSMRNPSLKMLATSSTHPLLTAFEESANQLRTHPNPLSGNFHGCLPRTLIAGTDIFLYEQLDACFQQLLEHPALQLGPEHQALKQTLKDVLTNITAVATISILENMIQNRPLTHGMRTNMLASLGLTLLLRRLNTTTTPAATPLFAKCMVPALINAVAGAQHIHERNAPKPGAPNQPPLNTLNVLTYGAYNGAIAATQVALYELLKANMPKNSAP